MTMDSVTRVACTVEDARPDGSSTDAEHSRNGDLPIELTSTRFGHHGLAQTHALAVRMRAHHWLYSEHPSNPSGIKG